MIKGEGGPLVVIAPLVCRELSRDGTGLEELRLRQTQLVAPCWTPLAAWLRMDLP